MATTTASINHITEDVRVCGGKACIDGTRITVKDVVCLHEEGYVPEQMRNVFATPLTPAQVYAALAYYHDHKEEIEASFEEEEKLMEESERKRDEYLKRHSES